MGLNAERWRLVAASSDIEQDYPLGKKEIMEVSHPNVLSRYECFIPSSDYTDPEVGRRERAKLWPKVWQIACREDEIPKVGDFVKYDIADESIIIVRVAQDRIDAYYNACQHRGRQLVESPRGNVARGFYCRYHGWRYKLNGALSHVHLRDDWPSCPAFTDGSLNLKRPRIDTWAGWVWVNMDENALSLADYLGDDLRNNLRNLDIQDMRFDWYETLIVDVNWKVVVEAFNEGYHVTATHTTKYDYRALHNKGQAYGLHACFRSSQGLSRYRDDDGEWKPTLGLADQLYRTSNALYSEINALGSPPILHSLKRLRDELPVDAPAEVVLPRMFELHRDELQAAGIVWPENLTLEDLLGAASDWHIFPNTILLPKIDGIIWYRMRPHPDDDQKCVFDIWSLRRFPPGEEPKVTQHISQNLEEFKGRNTFLEQDFSNLRGVQAGMRSRGWQGAFTNPSEELPIAHFHRMLRQYIHS